MSVPSAADGRPRQQPSLLPGQSSRQNVPVHLLFPFAKSMSTLSLLLTVATGDPAGVNTMKWVSRGDRFLQTRLVLALSKQSGDLRQRASAPALSHL